MARPGLPAVEHLRRELPSASVAGKPFLPRHSGRDVSGDSVG